MFMQIAIAAIGIGIVLMVGYLVIANVQSSLSTAAVITNPCYGANLNSSTLCGNNTAPCYLTPNVNGVATCADVSITVPVASTRATVFSGFALVAVGIIVLAAFGLISVFK